MTLPFFILVSLLNVAMLWLIVRARGIASAEGIMMAFCLVTVGTDNIGLLWDYWFNPGLLLYGAQEFTLRVYPTELHIAGALVFFAGLFIGNPTPVQPGVRLTDEELADLRMTGTFLVLTGAGLYLSGLLISGGGAYLYQTLRSFRSDSMPYGGFWYRGLDIAIFGLGLRFAATADRSKRALITLTCMIGGEFFLSANKGGPEKAIIWGFFLLYVYNRETFTRLLTWRRAVALTLVAFFGMGLKITFLSWELHHTRDESIGSALSAAPSRALEGYATRFSEVGVYRSYCQFITFLPFYQSRWAGYRVGKYALTAWIPGVIYRDKPPHPFHVIGVMTYPGFADSTSSENEAPGWVGAAMADDGIVTLILYLFVAGFFLGRFREFAIQPGKLARHNAYILFALLAGFEFVEDGVAIVVDNLALATAAILAACALSRLVVGRRDREASSHSLLRFVPREPTVAFRN